MYESYYTLLLLFAGFFAFTDSSVFVSILLYFLIRLVQSPILRVYINEKWPFQFIEFMNGSLRGVTFI